MKKLLTSFLLVTAACSITACQKTKEQFDFSKKAPDEFAVVKRAPLEMPPSFDVVPPRPGAPRPQEQATDQLARDAILGEDARKSLSKQTGVTEGEAVLLQKTGAASATPAIRAQVDKETAEIIKDETPGINKLKKMVGANPSEPDIEVVDPVAEANRIKQNKAQGKPANAGETAVKED